MDCKIVSLRECPDVVDTLAAWHHAQWGHLNPQRTLGQRAERLRSHCDADGIPTTFVAFDGDTLLGSASLIECDLHQRSDLTPWLASVYVAPPHRGRGVGNAVVARVEQHAESLGVETLYLFTPDREAFYARRGWRRFAEEELAQRKIVLMSLDVKPKALNPTKT